MGEWHGGGEQARRRGVSAAGWLGAPSTAARRVAAVALAAQRAAAGDAEAGRLGIERIADAGSVAVDGTSTATATVSYWTTTEDAIPSTAARVFYTITGRCAFHGGSAWLHHVWGDATATASSRTTVI